MIGIRPFTAGRDRPGDAFKRNLFKIYRYVTLNCSQLLIEYPEFMLFVQLDLCKTYNESLILGKLSLFLSTLFNTYLPYGLYRPPVLPIIVTGFTTGALFYTNFTDDQWRISIIESISIFAGYSIIVGHLLLPNFDRYFRMIYSTIVRRFSMWFSRNANEHIYDNIRNDEDIHGD